MNPVSIVTIREKQTLYKGDNPAERIELIKLEETDFDIVSQKDLYKVGDKAIYIQPDYCLSDISLFDGFIRPNDDESKSMLGKVGGLARRIRAKKFNFSKEPNGDVVYSNGILLPYEEVMIYLDSIGEGRKPINLTEKLSITKYEEPETTSNGGLNVNGGKPFPEGVYKTDEDNYFNVSNKLQFPIKLYGSEKCDGSSITIGFIPKYPNGFIASRNLVKPFMIRKHVGRREKTLYEKICFWTVPNLNIYKEVENDDDFIKYGKPYLEALRGLYIENLIFRGELNGGKIKGSGNKNNPASKEDVNIKWFGLDVFENNTCLRSTQKELEHFLTLMNKALSKDGVEFFKTVKCVFDKVFESKEELEKACNDYFKENMIEGIVIRPSEKSDFRFSCKFMNPEYDSKK